MSGDKEVLVRAKFQFLLLLEENKTDRTARATKKILKTEEIQRKKKNYRIKLNEVRATR